MADSKSFWDFFQQENVRRRDFLKKGVAVSGLVGLSSLIGPTAVSAAMDEPKKSVGSGRNIPCIDMHAHYVPLAYAKALKENGRAMADGVPLPAWSIEAQLAVMDRLQIATAMLSLSTPHFHFGDNAAACRLARRINEEGAKAASDRPDRFGFFATLPLPDVEGALKEIEYAMDVLQADGVGLMTHSSGIYLGDKRLEPVFAALSRREAVVVIHPTTPSAFPPNVPEDCPAPVLEFLLDTTRAVTNLILTGTLRRNSGIRLVVPHAGAFLPSFVDRLDGLIKTMPPEAQAAVPDIRDSLRQMYYDLAGFPVPLQLGALLQMTEPDHLLYGSDWPFAVDGLCGKLKEQLCVTELLNDGQRRAIFRDNALALFPRFNR